jgi:SAM-dependent methyltransferase
MNTNVDQVAYWNGVPGERWARDQEVIDQAFAAFTSGLIALASPLPGQRVLDVGCGCGTTALLAADAVGDQGAVVGVDVSAPMVARARERSVGRTNITYALADAASHDFGTTFDVALSRFGVMFFARPDAAFEHIRGALRPGGRLAFACWRSAADNAWVRVPFEAAAPHLPPAPPQHPDEPGPFAFADGERVRRLVTGAGFSDVAVTPFDADVVLSRSGLDTAVRFAMSTGPTARAIRDAGDDAKDLVRQALETRFRPFVANEQVTLGGAVWLVHAAVP